MRNEDSPTRFFELTHRGRGAIAAIAVAGAGSESVLEQCFTPINNRSLKSIRRAIVYGTWNSTGEDLIVLRSGKNEFEVHCHGGSAAVESIKHALREFQSEEVEELSQWQQQLTHAMSWWQAEIQEKLILSKTDRTAGILLQQLSLWRETFLEILDDCKHGDAEKQKQLSQRVESFLRWRELGEHLTVPWSVVFCGKPNAGKSSLVNAIVGFNRAIVHETQGTTRDILSQQTAIDGWPIEIKDTAGLRDSVQTIESLGIEKAISEIENADLSVLVCDVIEVDAGIKDVLGQLRGLKPKILVVNKIDLVGQKDLNDPELGVTTVFTSATTKAGLAQLQAEISKCIVPELPSAGDLVPVSSTQLDFLRELAGCLNNERGAEAIKLLQAVV